MPTERNQQWYLQRAAKYDRLAQYFKYIDAAQHIAYYHKHLHCLNQACQLMRTNNTAPFADTQQGHQARVRIFHGSPDAGPIDIYINGTRILKDFSYKGVSSYATLPAGSHQIDIYPAGMVSALVSRPFITEAGKVYTIAAVGIEANFKLALLEDHPEVSPGETKVRFVHLSHDSPAVDIAVKNRDVVFPNIAFSQASKYIALTPMTVDLEARIAGTQNAVLSFPECNLKQTRHTLCWQ